MSNGQTEEYVPGFGMPTGNSTEVVNPDALEAGLTDDKLVATVNFGQNRDALKIHLAETQSNSLTRVSSVEIPVKVPPTLDDENKKFIGYVTVVRGFVAKDKSTRVVVVLDLGGKEVDVLEYPFGEERSESIDHRCFTFLASDFEVTETEEKVWVDGKEVTQIKRTANYVAAPPHFTAVLTVSVQRRSPGSEAHVSIEEMEVIIPSLIPRKQ